MGSLSRQTMVAIACRAQIGALVKFTQVNTVLKFSLLVSLTCALTQSHSDTSLSTISRGEKCGLSLPITVQVPHFFSLRIKKARRVCTPVIFATDRRCLKIYDHAVLGRLSKSTGFTWITLLALQKSLSRVKRLHTSRWASWSWLNANETQLSSFSSIVTLLAKKRCFGILPNNSTPKYRCSRSDSIKHIAVVLAYHTSWPSKSTTWFEMAQCSSLLKQWEICRRRLPMLTKRKTLCTYVWLGGKISTQLTIRDSLRSLTRLIRAQMS